MMNTIFTNEEYLAQGFSKEELEDVRRSDILFNKRDSWTEAERDEYDKLVEKLGL